jgi:hypothetical protein
MARLWSPRDSAQLAVVDGQLYAVGGYDHHTRLLGELSSVL